MALQTEQIHLVHPEQSRIGGPMRRMTGGATFRLHRHVFKRERSFLVSVTLETDSKVTGARAQLTRDIRAVRVMAIRTVDQVFVDPVVIGHGELRPLRDVTAIAKLWLRVNQQRSRLRGMMRRMAAQASGVVCQVHRAVEVHVLRVLNVTGQTPLARLR